MTSENKFSVYLFAFLLSDYYIFYKIEEKKLTLTMKYGATTTTNTGGSPLVEKIYADVNIVLQKQ